MGDIWEMFEQNRTLAWNLQQSQNQYGALLNSYQNLSVNAESQISNLQAEIFNLQRRLKNKDDEALEYLAEDSVGGLIVCEANSSGVTRARKFSNFKVTEAIIEVGKNSRSFLFCFESPKKIFWITVSSEQFQRSGLLKVLQSNGTTFWPKMSDSHIERLLTRYLADKLNSAKVVEKVGRAGWTKDGIFMHGGKYEGEICPEALQNKKILFAKDCSRKETFTNFMKLEGRISEQSNMLISLSLYSILEAIFTDEGLVLPHYVLIRCAGTSIKAEDIAKTYFEVYKETETVSLSLSERQIKKKLNMIQDEPFFVRGEAESKLQNKRNNAQNNAEILLDTLLRKVPFEDGRKVRSMLVVTSDAVVCNFPLEDAVLFDFSDTDIDKAALSQMLRDPYIRGNFTHNFIEYAEKNQNFIRGKIRENKEKCAGFACQVSPELELDLAILVSCSQILADFARDCGLSLWDFWGNETEMYRKYAENIVKNYEATDPQGLDEIFIEKLRELLDEDKIKIVQRMSESVKKAELNCKCLVFIDETAVNLQYRDFEKIVEMISGNSCLSKQYLIALDEAGILIRNSGRRNYYERNLPILISGQPVRKRLVSLRREMVEKFGEMIF